MSQCTHNNHSHFLIWLVLFCCVLTDCIDCNGNVTRTKSKIRDLEYKVQQLENHR